MSKNIVICCDGTGNEYGKNNTNVVKLYALADKSDPGKQIAYYDPGVGTGGWEYDEATGDMKAKGDGATGAGLQKNIEDAYRYLMKNYADGDKIYLFGFSRGAFTARSLAGMLYRCGLLYPDMDNMVEYASKMYNSAGDPEGKDLAAGFKATFSRPCPVRFIGVWDTVASLALNAGKKFHDATLNPEVGYGCHAVALDEIRRKFPPSLWEARGNVEQVWFAGVHSDVGGWYKKAGLSDIALRWMGKKAKQHDMLINTAELPEGDPLAMQHDSHSGFVWSAMGKHIRELPKDAKVHESVKQRLGQSVEIGNDKSEADDRLDAYQPEAKLANGDDFSPDKVEFVGDDD